MTLSIPPLDPDLPGLCIAQRALPQPFLLEGARVRLAGRQTDAERPSFATKKVEQAYRQPAGAELGLAANLVLYPESPEETLWQGSYIRSTRRIQNPPDAHMATRVFCRASRIRVGFRPDYACIRGSLKIP